MCMNRESTTSSGDMTTVRNFRPLISYGIEVSIRQISDARVQPPEALVNPPIPQLLLIWHGTLFVKSHLQAAAQDSSMGQ